MNHLIGRENAAKGQMFIGWSAFVLLLQRVIAMKNQVAISKEQDCLCPEATNIHSTIKLGMIRRKENKLALCNGDKQY
jgi:hypothetical protein